MLKTETKTLMCCLTEHQLIERGEEMAKTYLQVAALDLEKKRITARIKPLDERIELLVTILDTKEEERQVECRWVYDFINGIKRLYREDTGEEIQSATIKDWERQQALPAVDEGLGLGAEDPQPDPENVCYNTGCLQFDETTENHCRSLQYTDDCDNPQGTGAPHQEDTNAGPETEEKTEGAEAADTDDGVLSGAGALEQVGRICSKCRSAHPDCDNCCNSCDKSQHCNTAQYCTLTNTDSICSVCTGQCGDYTPGTAVSECPGFLATSPANVTAELQQVQTEDRQNGPMSVAILLDAGFSRNAAKLLMAGFSLVSYDREAKTIYITDPDLRNGWVALDPFTTYAQAERALDRMLEDPGTVGIARNKKGSITQGAKHLWAFTFYRSEGIIPGHGTPRIKQGPNWTTWKKFETAEECAAAWEELLINDPKALED